MNPDLFIRSFQTDADANVIVDANGDTILTLTGLCRDGVPLNDIFGFQVSSAILQRESSYFEVHLSHEWASDKEEDGKYHIPCAYDGADLVALLILLVAMHQDFSMRTQDGRCLAVPLPSSVSLVALISVVRMTDYFMTRRACEMLADSSAPWFDQFKRNEKWAVPKKYKARTMMWWCLAREFESRILGRDTLMMAVQRVIVRYRGTFSDHYWPVSRAELESIDYDRLLYRMGLL